MGSLPFDTVELHPTPMLVNNPLHESQAQTDAAA